MDKIRSFFTTNVVRWILAIIFGIAAWIVVFNIQDQETTVYVDVPIEYINEALLLKNQKRVFLSGPATVSVSVSVHTSQATQVESSFFKCTADLTASTGADITRQSLRTEVEQVGGHGLILDWSYTRGDPFVTIALDEYVSNTFMVSAKWEDMEIEGMQLRDIQFSPETVTISGPKSKFTNVASIKVPLTLPEVARNLTNGIFDGSMPIKIYDATDTPLSDVTSFSISTEFVNVHAEIDNLASVPLKLTGTPNGIPAEGYYYNGATVDLENVTLLSLNDITLDSISIPLSDSDFDISGLTSSFDVTVDLSRYEPDGVNISEETATVHIQISANSTMNFSFYSVAMEHTDTSLYNYTLRNRPYVKVSGTAAAISALTVESFSPKVNVSGLGAGTYTVPVSISALPSGVTLIESNLMAEIQITYIETAPPETTTAPTSTGPDGPTESEPESDTPADETTEPPTEPTSAPPDESSPEETTPEPTEPESGEESTAAP